MIFDDLMIQQLLVFCVLSHQPGAIRGMDKYLLMLFLASPSNLINE